MENIGKINTNKFIREIELISSKVHKENVITDGINEYIEQQYIESAIQGAIELIDYNEWYIALENILNQLVDVGYKLEDQVLEFANIAFSSVDYKFNKEVNMKLIEDLSLRK